MLAFVAVFVGSMNVQVMFVIVALPTMIVGSFAVVIASGIIPGFHIKGFGSAILFSLVLSVVNYVAAHVAAGGADTRGAS